MTVIKKVKMEMEVDKVIADSGIEFLKDAVLRSPSEALDKGIEKISTNASVGAAVIKSNLPPIQKLAMTGAAVGVTAIGTKLGIDISSRLIENRVKKDRILNKIDPDRIPSPDDTFINSLLDKGDMVSPLQDLLHIQIIIHFYYLC